MIFCLYHNYYPNRKICSLVVSLSTFNPTANPNRGHYLLSPKTKTTFVLMAGEHWGRFPETIVRRCKSAVTYISKLIAEIIKIAQIKMSLIHLFFNIEIWNCLYWLSSDVKILVWKIHVYLQNMQCGRVFWPLGPKLI